MHHRAAGIVLMVVTLGWSLVWLGSTPLLPVTQTDAAPILEATDAATGLSAAEGQAGDQLTMKVSALNAENMVAAQFSIQFDNTVLRVADEGVKPGDTPAGVIFRSNVDNSVGSIGVAIVGVTPFNADSLTLLEVTFDLIGSPGDTTDVSLVDVLASDAAVQPLSVSAVDGTITILAKAPVTPVQTQKAEPLSPTAPSELPQQTDEADQTAGGTPGPSGPAETPSATQSSDQPGPAGGGCNPSSAPGVRSLAGTGDFLLLGLALAGVGVLRKRVRRQ